MFFSNKKMNILIRIIFSIILFISIPINAFPIPKDKKVTYDVIRKNKDYHSKLIKLNLAKVLALDPQEDILLQGLDEITIYSITEMIPGRYVTLRGHVKLPGRYQLLDDYTLHDLIFIGGGFIDEEWLDLTYKSRAEIIRVKPDSITKRVIAFNLEELNHFAPGILF